ncbi:MAG: HAD family phosphatase [Bacteroidetes bacterium]|nr:HAD family phosphatase [Bacteroidota bacterium]MCW5896651.1 HAD family phosphatase [Bacteroidota bacterium]
MVKGIIFDYGNVIARFDHMIFFRRLLPHTALTSEDILAEAKRASHLIIDYETGRITSDEFSAQVTARLKLSMPMPQFKESFVRIFERNPATLQLIRSLKPHFKLGLLSNTNTWHFETEMQTLEEFPLFDAVTLSFEVGAMKPAEILYRDILAKLDMRPYDCVYIDDMAEYVESAAALGFNAIQYTSHATLVDALKTLGVSV